MTSEQPTLLVLAAGMGSRYGGLKQLDPVGPSGETIMDYSIYDARKAGFNKVVFLIREEIAEIFREKIGAKYLGIMEVRTLFRKKVICLLDVIFRKAGKNHGVRVMRFGQPGKNSSIVRSQ